MWRSDGRNYGYEWAVSFSPMMLVFGALYAFILLAFALIWLDNFQPPVIGWILYPIELVLNEVFFPRAPTHVRPNGDALGVLFVTAVVFYVPYRIAGRCMARLRAHRI